MQVPNQDPAEKQGPGKGSLPDLKTAATGCVLTALQIHRQHASSLASSQTIVLQDENTTLMASFNLNYFLTPIITTQGVWASMYIAHYMHEKITIPLTAK